MLLTREVAFLTIPHNRGRKMSNVVKVLGLFGSPRKGGNTELLLDEALKGAAAEGATVEGIHLSDCRIAPCRECLGCFKAGACVITDEM